uniref:Uncharacterized protein n=1 Tax=Oryza punctata TaxID=4537 RepID=A0A0E0MMK9_ORYPU
MGAMRTYTVSRMPGSASSVGAMSAAPPNRERASCPRPPCALAAIKVGPPFPPSLGLDAVPLWRVFRVSDGLQSSSPASQRSTTEASTPPSSSRSTRLESRRRGATTGSWRTTSPWP